MAVLGIGESLQFFFSPVHNVYRKKEKRKTDCTVHALKVPLTHHTVTSRFYITYKDGLVA